MKRFVFAWVLWSSMHALGALPGVTEFRTSPEAIPDATLSRLLDERVAAADVVALGETLHGSAGFLRVQTRLVRYLVEKRGMRLIVWENPTLRSLELARWVAACATERTPVPIGVLYMPTRADGPLWEWICDFNRAHPANPVIFRGMDVWDRPWEHHARIRELSERVGIRPQLAQAIDNDCPVARAVSWAEVEAVLDQVAVAGGFRPEAAYRACRAALTAVLDAARSSGSTKQAARNGDAEPDFELALSASTLLGWLGFYNAFWTDDIGSWNERDRAQGRNLELIMQRHRAARAVLAAHTSHVSHNRSPADWWGYGDLKSGVFFFTESTGKKVFNIAFTAYEGSGTQGHWSLPTAPNSLDRKLHEAGHAFAFLPSNAPFLKEHARWWIQNGNFPGPYQSGVELVLPDHFDAYVFFDRSHIDEALPSRSMWRP